ncbi:MAG: hypothetical protein WCS87_10120 [Methylococcaceae bacterium]
MPKSTFIPRSDHDFLAWMDHFINNLPPDYDIKPSNLAAMKAACEDFTIKIAQTNDAAALAKQATADKTASRNHIEALIRVVVRQIKAHSDYTEGRGAKLGIIGPEDSYNLATSSPVLTGIDQTGGQVLINFIKYKSDGINIYSQRENDTDWVLLARATISPYLDNRPLLQVGKPELRRYTAVFMLQDHEIGRYCDDLVINCAP